MNHQSDKHGWLKNRGYLHITPKIDVYKRREEIISKVTNTDFVAKHAFFPLMHAVITERKYKKSFNSGLPGHKIKERPLHYATHIDALIFGYYAQVLLSVYEERIKSINGLADCIIAYRKIPIDDGSDKGKSTIHFAKETFDAISTYSERQSAVLMFDIKSFFSQLDHEILKNAWCDLLGVKVLPRDHYNVFKASTKFRYILRDDLRVYEAKKGKRGGFNERKLAHIRKLKGEEAFFESIDDFKTSLRNKSITVYKEPYRNNSGKPIGIPQGLPISAVLANLYLLEFDLKIFNKVVKQLGGFYRRYSDDILIVCNVEEVNIVKDFVYGLISDYKLSISKEKTEEYFFERNKTRGVSRLRSYVSDEDGKHVKKLTYLGFEFDGERVYLKSANLSRFYRRMIYSIKKKTAIAGKIARIQESNIIVYKGRLKRLYNSANLKKEKIYKSKKLIKGADQYYQYVRKDSNSQKKPANYITYAQRASTIMNQPGIMNQLRNRNKLFNVAMARHVARQRARIQE